MAAMVRKPQLTTISKISLPEGATLRKRNFKDYYFAYPDGGMFAEFSHSDGTSTKRLIFDHNNVRYRVDFEKIFTDLSANGIAEALFQSSPSYPENIPPQHLLLENSDAWYLRHLFIEGGRSLQLIDTAFIQAKDDVYRLQFSAMPENHAEGVWLFELVLHTLNFVF